VCIRARYVNKARMCAHCDARVRRAALLSEAVSNTSLATWTQVRAGWGDVCLSVCALCVWGQRTHALTATQSAIADVADVEQLPPGTSGAGGVKVRAGAPLHTDVHHVQKLTDAAGARAQALADAALAAQKRGAERARANAVRVPCVACVCARARDCAQTRAGGRS
jgi:hypothetical protein